MAAAASRRDLTTGPIAATLLRFALPTLGSSILQSLNGSVNAIWVGRFLGENALAATSNANLVMFLMFAAMFGFGMAATILVGQRMGARDLDGARRAVGSALGLFAGLSIVIAVVGWLLAPDLLALLATPSGARAEALAYLRVIFLAMPASFVSTLLIMAMRGMGDSLTPLWFMGLAVALDIALNPLLIAGIGPFPALGIAGSAWATLIATVVSLAALLGWIYARDLPVRLRGGELAYLRPAPALGRAMLGKGLPMGLQMIVISVSALAMIGLVNREGVIVTAAYGVTQQLWTYVQMPAMAIGAAVSAMAAQNIGAGRWDRVGAITRWGIVFNLVLTGALVLALTLADHGALGLFLGAGSPAIPIAEHIHRLAGWSFILFGVSLVLFATVRANGAVIAPLVILTVALFPVRLGLARLAYPVLGADAIWWSFPAGSLATLLLGAGYYRFGSWRKGSFVPPAQAEEAALADGDACGKLSPTG
ncbi:MATE family efflux transporter [Sphingomonas sp. 1P06PA]|uniref:MATE family efflux transporter n=1 Tax=Sphingomonas sp. 1P06PA TaxID=554121 RepID=UPI0039A5853A